MKFRKFLQRQWKLPSSLIAMLYAVLSAFGCLEQQVPQYLEPQRFAKIYAEAIMKSQTSTDRDSLSHLAVALEKYKVTEEEFKASIAYYNNNPELWLEAFNSVVEELQEKMTDETKSERAKREARTDIPIAPR